MSLDFAPLTGYEASGEGVGIVTGSSRGSEFATFGRGRATCSARGHVGTSGRGRATASARGSEFSSYGRGLATGGAFGFSGIEDPHPDYGIGVVTGSAHGVGFSVLFGEGSGRARGAARGSEFDSYGRATVTGSAHGAEMPQLTDGVILLLMSPGILIVTSGYVKEKITEQLALGDSSIINLTQLIRERFRLTETPSSYLAAFERITEHLDFADTAGIIWNMLITEFVDFTDTGVGWKTAIARVAEVLNLVAGANTTLEAFNLITETIALHDTLAILTKEQITEQAVFNTTLTVQREAAVRLVESILFTAVPAATLRLSALVTEKLAIGDTLNTSLEAFERIVETVGFAATIHLGEDIYFAWVVNTESKGAWSYDNYPFNSMTEKDGRYFGMAADGLYEIGGDKDAGEDIKARFRRGLSDLGAGRIMRIPSLYVGYSSDGPVVLKVITVDIDGERTENWYKLTPRGAGGLREGRIKIGRGARSRYWDFEIVNVEGSKLAVGDLKFFPMVLDRRVRGRDE